jgi:hypothetical protein
MTDHCSPLFIPLVICVTYLSHAIPFFVGYFNSLDATYVQCFSSIFPDLISLYDTLNHEAPCIEGQSSHSDDSAM